MSLIFKPSVSPIVCPGNNLSQEAKIALSRMLVGQKAYIDNIKVQTPKGIVPIPMAQIRLKS